MHAASDVITIVSGLPRSGTSMMMKMLEAGGLEAMTDHVRKADIDNPRGYYEYEIVKQIEKDTSWVPGTRGRAFKMVATLLPHLPPGYRYQVVFMRRDMTEMLRSQDKMLTRLGNPGPALPHGTLAGLFQKQLDQVMDWLGRQDHIRVLYVEYGSVLGDPATEAARIAGFAEQPLDAARMAAVVDPELYRNRG